MINILRNLSIHKTEKSENTQNSLYMTVILDFGSHFNVI